MATVNEGSMQIRKSSTHAIEPWWLLSIPLFDYFRNTSSLPILKPLRARASYFNFGESFVWRTYKYKNILYSTLAVVQYSGVRAQIFDCRLGGKTSHASAPSHASPAPRSGEFYDTSFCPIKEINTVLAPKIIYINYSTPK